MYQIQSTAKFINDQYTFFSLANKETELKTDFNTKEPKLTKDGKPIYKGDVTVIRRDEEGNPSTKDMTVTVNLLEQTNLEFGGVYKLDGNVVITPWASAYNGKARVNYVLLADRLVKVEDK